MNISNNVRVYGSSGYSMINEDYYKGVQAAGGIPVIIPIIGSDIVDPLLSRLDGIILSGGGDLDPWYFGESPIKDLNVITPDRDGCEIEIAKKSIEMSIPILGICRGLQILNVAMGGTLYQDIYAQKKSDEIIKHTQMAPRWYGSHKVFIESNTMLLDIMKKETILVNSFHHQAIKTLGDGLKINAYSPDKIIEGIEGTDEQFILGVQWHPENMWEKNKIFLELFKAVVGASKKNN